jgi:DNA-binding SARP family transcriptional activator/Tfp pilus assembly protein PilF
MVRFRVLGPIEVWAGQSWSGIGAPKWRALLATLLLNPGQAVSTDRLIAELWGDQPPDRAANLVSVYVLRLRRLLDDSAGQVLTTRAPGYQLRLDPGDLDAGRFEALTGQGRQALNAGNFRRAAEVLAEALALWRGPALADIPPSELVAAEAARLEESRLTALELRIEADLGCGQHAQLVPELRRLMSDHPLREGLWTLLMRALDAAGRRAEALAAYGQAREVIAAELGVDPGPEMQRLFQVMLTADALTSPAGPDATPSGGLPVAPPAESSDGVAAQELGTPPRSAPARSQRVPAQLPADVPDFTNRESHLDRLQNLIRGARERENPAMPVAVVAGTPGLGKTAFAVHAAHALRQDFPDGQLYVNLQGGSEQPAPPDAVLARFLRDLGVDGVRVPVDAEERAAMYRTRLAGRRTLVLLDDARQAAQVRPLLPGTGSCAVIVTSRNRLSDLAGSSLLDLELLDDDQAAELFTRIIGTERAESEPTAMREVLATCAGLPLAIRIAGARLTARQGWSIRTLADRLSDQQRRMDELTAGDLAVRACFQVSFDSIQHPEHRDGLDPAHVFRLLGLWQGPSVSLQAAAALVGRPEPQVAAALEILVDAHLLESPTPDRYQFHDLLRDYAAERARADEPPQVTADALRRLLSWYLRTADAAAAVVAPYLDRPGPGPDDGGHPAMAFANADQALDWCEQERANFVAATNQAASLGHHDIAWKLPVAMRVCLGRLGYRAEWLATHRIALVSARELGDREDEAWVLSNLGTVLAQQRVHEAIGYYEQALAIYRETGNRRSEAEAANNLAFTYLILGQHDEAVTALQAALTLQRQTGRRYGEGMALCNLAEAYVELGRHEEAIASAQDALAILREVGSVRDEGYALYNLGRASLELGRLADAASLFVQAREKHHSAGDRYGEARDLHRIGIIHAREGHTGEAREAWNRARRMLESLGEDGQAAEVTAQLRELAAGSGDDPR